MQTTNIRYVVPSVVNPRALVEIRPPMRRANPANYAKANQRWWVEVRFNCESDIAVFEKSVKGSDVRLIELGNKFFIEDPTIPDTGGMGIASFQYATDGLPRVNAAIDIVAPFYVPAAFESAAELSENGTGRGIATAPMTVPGIAELNAVRAFLQGPETAFGAIMHLCTRNQDVSEALLYFGAGGNPWANLYKVCEVVEEHHGGKEAIFNRGWCSKVQWGRFKRTANHQEAIGAFSRHARTNAVAPPNPMSLQDARSFVREVLRGWVKELLNRQTL